MPILSDFYAPRIRIPQMIQRGKTQTVELSIYRDGSIVTPTAATYNLLKANGEDLISATAATIVSSVCKYTINSSILPETLELSDGWFELWEVEIGGVSFTFQRPAYLCRRPLYMVVSDLDLETSYSDLADLLPSSYTDGYQKWIDEAWVRILERLRNLGNLPYLVTDPQSLRTPHLELTLALIWRNMATSLGQSNGRYIELYREHLKFYDTSFKSLSFRYDGLESGRSEDPNRRKAAVSMISTANPPQRYFKRNY